jgi:hypothetical protein
MALTVTHAKTNGVADWTQAELDAQIALGNFAPGTTLADIVLPSDWNDGHSVSGDFDDSTGTINGTNPSALTAQYSIVQLLLMGL